MAGGISLIAGLGNPGSEYVETRHNAGFRFLDMLLAGSGVTLKTERRFAGKVARHSISGREVWLIAPDTFMNHSGEAVSKIARFYKIPPEEILVVHDELDLPPGTARLKTGGGAGGHNGLVDLIEQLGTPEFARLRIGVGKPATASQGASYVLRRAPQAEQALIDDAIRATLDQLPDIVHGDMQKAMNSLHAHVRT
jgi:PTH1 family peptidyl-tRNA hydrolase